MMARTRATARRASQLRQYFRGPPLHRDEAARRRAELRRREYEEDLEDIRRAAGDSVNDLVILAGTHVAPRTFCVVCLSALDARDNDDDDDDENGGGVCCAMSRCGHVFHLRCVVEWADACAAAFYDAAAGGNPALAITCPICSMPFRCAAVRRERCSRSSRSVAAAAEGTGTAIHSQRRNMDLDLALASALAAPRPSLSQA
jgi:hypothetical protein